MNKLTFWLIFIGSILFFTGIFYFVGLNHSSYGWYNTLTSNIIINAKDISSAEEAEKVFHHEYGHYVFSNLNVSQKATWKKIHETITPPTEYSQVNYKEDFAESYVLFQYEEGLDLARQEFMKEVLDD